jgi:hypothetical protein
MNPNSTYAVNNTFGKQRILNHVPRDHEEEAAALRYLDKHAPDLVGMVMGGVL